MSLIKFPCYVSDKEDGIRCSIMESPRTGNRLVGSRSEKPIPNLHIRNTIYYSNLPFGVDGELLLANGNFQNITSAVMSISGQFNFIYKIHDYYGCGRYVPFDRRWEIVKQLYEHNRNYEWLAIQTQHKCHDLAKLTTLYEDALARGKEGVMVRSPDGFYKPGKSTMKQQTLLKLKPFVDSEAVVSGFVELEYENKPSTRSGMMGALKCHDETRAPDGRNFEIGTGFTENQRREIWQNKDKYLGKVLTYKYQAIGVKHKPRTPVYLRWREDVKI